MKLFLQVLLVTKSKKRHSYHIAISPFTIDFSVNLNVSFDVITLAFRQLRSFTNILWNSCSLEYTLLKKIRWAYLCNGRGDHPLFTFLVFNKQGSCYQGQQPGAPNRLLQDDDNLTYVMFALNKIVASATGGKKRKLKHKQKFSFLLNAVPPLPH
jgi:hypothetical protein